MTYTVRFTESLWQALQAHLWMRSDIESASVMMADSVPGSHSSVLHVRRVVQVPSQAYRQRSARFIEIDPIWMNAQCFEARRSGMSVLTAHTHLTSGPAGFSWADDQGDARLLPALSVQMPDVAHGALNITRTDATARLYYQGSLVPARVVVIGKRLTIFPRPNSPSHASASHGRQELALGKGGQRELERTRVAVVGLGGTGSVVATLLAHLGFRNVVMMDADTVEESNLSRILGSAPPDVDAALLKVSLARREFLRCSPSAEVKTHDWALDTEEDWSELAQCDLIFSCVDRLTPRALLNRLAYAAGIPVIDMGSAFRVGTEGKITSQGGKVAIIGPGRPCLWCWGDLDAERIRVEGLSAQEREREAEDGYIVGSDEPQPSVVTFNASLASAAVTEALRMVTGFAGSEVPPDRLNFDFATGTVSRAIARPRDECRFCGKSREA